MAQFVNETFSGTAGATLQAYNAAWSKYGTPDILITAAGRIRSDAPSTTAIYEHSGTPASADYRVSADFVYVGSLVTQPGILLRRTATTTYYFARYDTDLQLFKMYKVVSGSTSLIGTSAESALAVGETMRVTLEAIGTALKVYRDGVEVLSVADSSITGAGKAGVRLSTGGSAINDALGLHLDNFSADDGALAVGAAPAGTVTIGTITTGTTSASVTYSYSAADHTGFEYRIDGGSAATIGASPATITGLAASTSYDIEVRAINASGAGAWSAISTFTTDAPSGDTTAPTLTGSITISALTDTSYTASWPAGSDDTAVTGYEYQIDSGGWTSVGTALTVDITGRTPEATESFQVRAFDAAGNRSTALSVSVTLNATPVAGAVTVTAPLKNNAGTVRASESGVGVALLQATDFTYGLTTDASGMLEAVTGATPGEAYYVVIRTADGGVGITGPITAS